MAKKEAYITGILKELRSGNAERGKVLAKLGKKWQMGDRTFDRYWKIANERYIIEANEVNIAAKSILVSKNVESTLNGLKTKSERVAILQTQIDNCIKELESGETTETVTAAYMGSIISEEVKRKHTPNETQLIRRTLKDLQAEISKIEGDYAPTTARVEVVKEQPLFEIQ